MKGKLIVIEGTDCSGKETQSNKLVEFLNNQGINTVKFSFPAYDSPTGKIIAGAYLGKKGYMDPVFSEGAVNVDPYCASMYYAIDRKYNIKKITDELEKGNCVVLDRYIDSNLAHHASKLPESQHDKFFDFIEQLEYNLLELPRADIGVFLHMPTWASKILKSGREEVADQHEQDENYLLKSENVYIKIAKLRNMLTVECTEGEKILSVEEISENLCKKVVSLLK